MRRVIVRYRVKPERLEEHEALIRDVFAELANVKPAGLRYGAFRQDDGLSFVHVAFVDAEKNPLLEIAAFAKFTAKVEERCDAPPMTTTLAVVGTFGF
jgi:hypothetical protein